MSISDAMGILLGGNNAATQYLQKTTSSQLKSLFLPKVQASLKSLGRKCINYRNMEFTDKCLQQRSQFNIG
jgi:hypothetical protein